MCADIINLRLTKKRKARAQKEARAAENRLKFGRTKQEKARDLLEDSRAKTILDQKKLDPTPDPDEK